MPDVVIADCLSTTQFESYSIRDNKKVILFDGEVQVAIMDLNCTARPTSTIRFLKTLVCSGDDILVDDSRCKIFDLTLSELDPRFLLRRYKQEK